MADNHAVVSLRQIMLMMHGITNQKSKSASSTTFAGVTRLANGPPVSPGASLIDPT